MKYLCKICNNYESEKLRSQFATHITTKHGIKTFEYFTKYENFTEPLCECGKVRQRKSGLTYRPTCGNPDCKFKNSSKAQTAKWLSENGEHFRKNASIKRCNYMKLHPENTAWRKKDRSWPEKFFEKLITSSELINYNIISEYSVFPYYVDFAFIDQKVAVEIDGAQHLTDYMIKHDHKKDKILQSHGWRVFRIPASILYKPENLHNLVNSIVKFINTDQLCSSPQFIPYKQYKDQINDQIKLDKKNKLLHIKEQLSQINVLSKKEWYLAATNIVGITRKSIPRYIKREFLDLHAQVQKLE